MQVPLFPQLSQSDTKSRCILSFQGLGLSFEARTGKVCALTLLCLRLGVMPFGLLDRRTGSDGVMLKEAAGLSTMGSSLN